MNDIVYLRPLRIEDAKTSFHWRNMPELWTHTKFRTDVPITFEKESAWMADVINREDERRFAICSSSDHEYIGNVQLVKIRETTAEFHLVIGNQQWWGKGVGKLAAKRLLEYAFSALNLSRITLEVHLENVAALSIYKKLGFEDTIIEFPFVQMELTQLNFKRSTIYEENHHTFAEG